MVSVQMDMDSGSTVLLSIDSHSMSCYTHEVCLLFTIFYDCKSLPTNRLHQKNVKLNSNCILFI